MRFITPAMAGILVLSLSAAWAAQPASSPFPKGETVIYTIKKMGLKAGEATLVFEGETTVDGRAAYLISFRANGTSFLDEEKIYLDPKTFLPIRVERNVNITIMGKKERIVEYYDQKNFTVKIIKTTGGKTEEQVIKKKRSIENLYGFIYRFRKEGKFVIGENLRMNLPTADVKLKLAKMEKLKINGGQQETYFMESDPSKYKVWFDTSAKKVALRIDGAIGFGNTSMVMRAYSPGGLR